ncbi:hypothetical protein ZWY2020_041909, partial [Hordeum vulgare]
MGKGSPGGMGKQGGLPGDRKPGDGVAGDKKDKKFEPPPACCPVAPLSKCHLRLLKLDRVKDYLLMKEEFVVDDLRGTPMSIGSLEEIIDESHAIVSSSVGPEYYVSILMFVDKDQLEPGCFILMHNKVRIYEVDPMVSVMKVEKVPLESYADIGGLDAQIQEIKEAVELPLTHPELYEDIGIRPPKGVILYEEPGTGKTLLAKVISYKTHAIIYLCYPEQKCFICFYFMPKCRIAEHLCESRVMTKEEEMVGCYSKGPIGFTFGFVRSVEISTKQNDVVPESESNNKSKGVAPPPLGPIGLVRPRVSFRLPWDEVRTQEGQQGIDCTEATYLAAKHIRIQ